MNRKLLVGIVALVIAVAGIWGYSELFAPETQEGDKSVTIEVKAATQEIDTAYAIETDEEFLYDLLMAHEETLGVVILESSFGPMLIGLEGYTADESKNEFYHILINGEPAMVGIKDIPVLDGDVYTFELTNW